MRTRYWTNGAFIGMVCIYAAVPVITVIIHFIGK
jgi:hypothetical protein